VSDIKPATDEQATKWEQLAERATPNPIEKIRYSHGGGRAFTEVPNLKLVLDCYSVDDREFYFSAREIVPALIARIRADADELAAWRVRDKESEAFAAHLQQLIANVEVRNEQLAKALESILLEMRGRGWNDRQVNDIVNGYANRIEAALS